jgi:hypothetical protein
VPGWTATDAIAAAIAEVRATERAAADQLRADVEKLAEEWESGSVTSERHERTNSSHRRQRGYAAGLRNSAARLRAILDGGQR